MSNSFCALDGIIAPNLTPFNDDLSIAEDLYISHAKDLLARGCVGLAPFGTTGEALSVGMNERMTMLTSLINAGVDPASLIPGTGLTNIYDTAILCRHAVDMGCRAVMVLPPFYFKNVPDLGLVQYFQHLIEAVNHNDLRIFLYHIPQTAGVGLPICVVRQLKETYPDIIVGIKDSSGDINNTMQLLDIDDLIVYPGAELYLMDCLPKGGHGCITASANLNIENIKKITDHYFNGDMDAANAAAEPAIKYRDILQKHPLIPSHKRLMHLITNDARWANTRPPLLPFDLEKGRELQQQLANL